MGYTNKIWLIDWLRIGEPQEKTILLYNKNNNKQSILKLGANKKLNTIYQHFNLVLNLYFLLFTRGITA